MDICFRDACSGVKSREAFIIGLPGGQRPVKIYICPCRKKTKLRTELSGVACPIPPSMEPISAERGRVISGRQGKTELKVYLERTQNYCMEFLALHLRRMII